MQSLERAAALLRSASSPDRVAEILSELGFTDPLLPLDRNAVSALGLPANLRSAHITQAIGALRGLALDIDATCELRETLRHVANALARTASQLLWLVVAFRHAPADLAILCWRSVGSRVRVTSLICRRDRIVQSDAETLCTLASVGGESDLLTHARWLDVLGRQAITNRFFRALDKTVNELSASLTGRIERSERRELALLYISRLIFLSFLEAKGWLNGDFSFLANGFSRCMEAGGRYQKRILEPLFFGTLNTRIRARSPRAREFGRIPFLNGGLFSRSHLEKQRRSSTFSDECFGVDLNPMAVWLCELRLWLSIVIESDEPDPMRIAPLPNLDRHIRVGDSLSGSTFDDRGTIGSSRKLASLRTRYMRATGPRKLTLARALDRLERSAAVDVLARRRVRFNAQRKELLVFVRARDLFGLRHPPVHQTRLRLEGIRRGLRDIRDKIKALREGAALPFSFAAHFSDIAAAGGFDIVIGNPPWVRVHRIAELSRRRLRQEFTVYRRAAWESGAESAG